MTDKLTPVRSGCGGEVKILDVTCGDRTIWFQKQEPHTIYCDKRKEEWDGMFGKVLNKDGKKKRRHLVIEPDCQCDFTSLPFEDETFSLVVFDPPHIVNLAESSWMRKSYGSLDDNWRELIHDGFAECMRVLKPDGVLIFKWSDVSINTREVIKTIGEEPLFGHRSGKKMNTHWMCFMKGIQNGEEAVVAWNRAMGNGDALSPVERTAKVETVEKPNVFKCGECGQYFHSTAWGSPVEYCSRCGAKLEWSE